MSDPLSFPCRACGGLNRVDASRLTSGPRCGRCHEPLDTSGMPIAVDDDALERLVRIAPVPVLVDFWAAWCGPCRAVAPHLEDLGRRHAGRLIVAKLDVDQHKRVANTLGVTGIPTLAVYHRGALKTSEAGARTGPALEAFVAPWIGA